MKNSRPVTEIHLFGSLRKAFERLNEHPVQLELDESAAIVEILKDLAIDPDKIQLAMLNYKAVSKAATVHPGDRLSLFPTEYPIFADWKDFRFN